MPEPPLLVLVCVCVCVVCVCVCVCVCVEGGGEINACVWGSDQGIHTGVCVCVCVCVCMGHGIDTRVRVTKD